MKRAPTLTKRERRMTALADRESAARAMPLSAEREARLAEVSRARVAIQLRRKG